MVRRVRIDDEELGPPADATEPDLVAGGPPALDWEAHEAREREDAATERADLERVWDADDEPCGDEDGRADAPGPPTQTHPPSTDRFPASPLKLTDAERDLRDTWAGVGRRPPSPIQTGGVELWHSGASVDAVSFRDSDSNRFKEHPTDERAETAANQWVKAHDPRESEEGCRDAAAGAFVRHGSMLGDVQAAAWRRGPETAERRAAKALVVAAIGPLWDDGYRHDYLAAAVGCSRPTLTKMMKSRDRAPLVGWEREQ